MDQSTNDTPAPSPERRAWAAPVLSRLPATLIAGGGEGTPDGDGQESFLSA